MTATTIDRPAAASVPEKPEKPNESKSLWHYLRISLSIVLLLFMVALAVLAVGLPAATKAIPLTVLTSSMEPGLPPGTLIVVRAVEPDDIRIGDVITYQIRSGEPEVITHRVISIAQTSAGERTFTLQGDNNAVADDPIGEVQVQGRLWYSIPYLGWVNTWVNGENRGWIVPIVAGGLFAYAGWMVISSIVGGRRKKRRQASRLPGRHAA